MNKAMIDGLRYLAARLEAGGTWPPYIEQQIESLLDEADEYIYTGNTAPSTAEQSQSS